MSIKSYCFTGYLFHHLAATRYIRYIDIISSLKKYYLAECENWMRNCPARTITTFEVASKFTYTFAKTATVVNVLGVFIGIWSFNDDLFSDFDI